MRKLTLAMQMTVDGFIAGPNGEMDWLIGEDEEWRSMFEDLVSVDTILVGAGMYPGYSEYWQSVLKDPSADPNERAYASLASRTPHIVFSRSMEKTGWNNTRIARDVETEVTALRKQKGGDIIAWGGASLANTLIGAGLVDEYRLVINPKLLGRGLRLFGEVRTRRALVLSESRQLGKGLVLLRYGSSGTPPNGL